jgi:hypothetical protein
VLAEKLYVTTTQAIDMDMQLILAAAGPRFLNAPHSEALLPYALRDSAHPGP